MTKPEFSITTDLTGSRVEVEPLFPAFAAAGFTAVHWCQHWAGEPVFYSRAYGRKIAELAAASKLRVRDVHGYSGTDGEITYTDELFLAANINRLEFCEAVGAEVLVLHLPVRVYKTMEERLANAAAMLRALEQPAKEAGVRLAVENLGPQIQIEGFIEALLERFGPEQVGFCYDSGHALFTGQADLVRRLGGRVIATHLHDNNGHKDEHRLPGLGKVDWPMVVSAMKAAGYTGTWNLEVHHDTSLSLADFCKKAFAVIRGLWEAQVERRE